MRTFAESNSFGIDPVYFEGRELKEYAEPVLANELREGEIYFSVNYVDDDMLIPVMETVVFIGRNLEPGDVGQVYFQDVESHREGVRYAGEIISTDFAACLRLTRSGRELSYFIAFEGHGVKFHLRSSHDKPECRLRA
jgi:hypothetical protein